MVEIQLQSIYGHLEMRNMTPNANVAPFLLDAYNKEQCSLAGLKICSRSKLSYQDIIYIYMYSCLYQVYQVLK